VWCSIRPRAAVWLSSNSYRRWWTASRPCERLLGVKLASSPHGGCMSSYQINSK
jgi:hypothetical protein